MANSTSGGFDMNLYTTRLDPNKISEDKRRAAVRIAQEIEEESKRKERLARSKGRRYAGEYEDEVHHSPPPREREPVPAPSTQARPNNLPPRPTPAQAPQDPPPTHTDTPILAQIDSNGAERGREQKQQHEARQKPSPSPVPAPQQQHPPPPPPATLPMFPGYTSPFVSLANSSALPNMPNGMPPTIPNGMPSNLPNGIPNGIPKGMPFPPNAAPLPPPTAIPAPTFSTPTPSMPEVPASVIPPVGDAKDSSDAKAADPKPEGKGPQEGPQQQQQQQKQQKQQQQQQQQKQQQQPFPHTPDALAHYLSQPDAQHIRSFIAFDCQMKHGLRQENQHLVQRLQESESARERAVGERQKLEAENQRLRSERKALEAVLEQSKQGASVPEQQRLSEMDAIRKELNSAHDIIRSKEQMEMRLYQMLEFEKGQARETSMSFAMQQHAAMMQVAELQRRVLQYEAQISDMYRTNQELSAHRFGGNDSEGVSVSPTNELGGGGGKDAAGGDGNNGSSKEDQQQNIHPNRTQNMAGGINGA